MVQVKPPPWSHAIPTVVWCSTPPARCLSTLTCPNRNRPDFSKNFLANPTPPRRQMSKVWRWQKSRPGPATIPNGAGGFTGPAPGLRLLATQGLVEADSDLAEGVFEALGADPLYRKLCKTQKCFRARLTPKPWRCGIHRKPQRWPWLDAKQETRFQKWEAQYLSYSANWATCEFIRQIGNATVHPEVQPHHKAS